MATPQRVVQDRVASVFVPAFELTCGLFDSTEARECLTRLERVLAGASPAASGNRVLAAGSDVQFYLLAPGLPCAPRQPDKNALVEVHPEMGLPLASDLALETADRVAPVATG